MNIIMLVISKRSYCAYFAAIYLLYLGFLAEYFRNTGGALPAGPWLMVIPLLEVALFCLTGASLLARRDLRSAWLLRPASLTIPIVIALAYIAQCYTLHLSGSYLTVLALENIGEIRLVKSTLLNSLLLASFAGWLLVIAVELRGRQTPHHAPSPRRRRAVLVALALTYSGMFFAQPEETGLIALQANQSPVLSLAKTFTTLLDYRQAYQNPERWGFGDTPGNTDDSGYPFMKERVYQGALPFASSGKPQQQPNVIVIFAEGISARLIEAYGSRLAGLMPNVERFSQRAMVVDRYFNHTAATYRGLQGQLVSGYPFAGGSQDGSGWDEGENADTLSGIRYLSLPQILGKRGYTTYFLSPHPDTVKLNTMLRALGFDTVYQFDSLSTTFLDQPPSLTAGSLSDADLFTALTNFLAQRDATVDPRPFFIGLYNIGTHAFLDAEAQHAPYGDGTNPVLNRFHNFDRQFGRFLDAFFASPRRNDTLLVLTSDHATFPEPHYVAAVSDDWDFLPYFVDRIPLMIYDPFLMLPTRFNAAGRSSLDFAPTLLHLLGIEYAANSFVGRSLFDTARPLPFSVAAIGSNFYLIDGIRVYHERNMPERFEKSFASFTDVIHNYYAQEQLNRIAPESESGTQEGHPILNPGRDR